ncbi:MAG: alanine--tRNA ligase [Thermodesulfobacteriota bacterium]
MDFREIRRRFLNYFKDHNHRIVPSSSLIPRDDPTLLFTNAGMVQFKAAFLGEENPGYTRAATSQKCVRAGGKHNDLENVGYTPRHHTFFEMLGNFSFGDYFKEEAILWGWELLTEGYKLPPEKLYASVYQDDDEAYRIWNQEIGIPTDRIVRLGEKENFWAMGDTGPCGPCSEIHIDQGPSVGCGKPDCAPGCDCDRYLEIWNLVFTQFDRGPEGRLTPLPKPNIDTGMGLERLTAVVQGAKSNYDTDIFKGIISAIEGLSPRRYGQDERQDVAFRVISDHARAVAFMIGDGIMPSNEGRGYVLRRIIRRAVRFGQVVDLKDPFLRTICDTVIGIMGPDYPELDREKQFIQGVVDNEEKRFSDTLNYSMKVLEEEIRDLKASGRDTIPGEVVFKLYDTYGLPLDIVQDVARDEHLRVDTDGYQEAMTRQRRLSQASWKGSGDQEIPEAFREMLSRGVATHFMGYDTLQSESWVLGILSDGAQMDCLENSAPGATIEVVLDQTPFYAQSGGQVGDQGLLMAGDTRFRVTDTVKYGTDLIVHKGVLEVGTLRVGDALQAQVDPEKRAATARNHSATHLLHAALRQVLGDHVKQAGSLVSPERLRFDFSHFAQVDSETLMEIERIVNRHIRENFPLRIEQMSKESAMKTGATAIFEERYGDTVRLVRIGDGVSMELCGGTHVARTGDIGLFRIAAEGAVAANMRRIEAFTGEAALAYDQNQEVALRHVASLLKATPETVGERIERLLDEIRSKEREIESLKGKLLTQKSEDLLSGIKEVNNIRVVAREVEAESPRELRDAGDRIRDKLGSGIVLLGARVEDRAILTCMITPDLTHRFKAGDIVKHLSAVVGGKGGGRPDMAQGGGNRPEKIEEAMETLYRLIEEKPL